MRDKMHNSSVTNGLRLFVFIGLIFTISCLIIGCGGGSGGGDDDEDNNNQQNNSAPNPPDNLQYLVISSSQINIEWNDNSDNENGFEIEQSQDNLDYTTIGNVDENTITYNVTGLSEGVTYYFRVLAINDYGDSEYSNIIVGVISSILNNNYTGFLQLRFSNVFPEFNASTQVSVEIDKYGGVSFGTGILSYEGDDNNGQARIKRSGTLTLNPYGNVYNSNSGIVIDVDENTSLSERLQQWVWDGATWIQVVDENISDTWNGGLGFNLDEAATTGSIVSVITANGSVIWTLTLTPTLVD
jgi:hypothetical protein